MMRISQVVVLALGVSVSAITAAQTVELPKIQEKDAWTYRITTTARNGSTTESILESNITRVSSTDMVLSRKRQDSNLPGKEVLLDLDWGSRSNINGKQTLVHEKFNFPMSPNKTWKLEVTQEKPNAQLKLHQIQHNYKVIGWEEVTVPAGKFKALKIEDTGNWRNEFNPTPVSANSQSQLSKDGATIVVQSRTPTTPQTMSGRFYNAYWYVPELKREAKAIEEDYTATGELGNRLISEMLSYRVN